MQHEDPALCPACRHPHGGLAVCTSCGLELFRTETQNARKALAAADAWIRLSREAATPAPVGETRAPVPAEPVTPAAAPARTWTAGGVLLTLGAGCLVVAGLVFVGVAWGVLGPGGRALVLLAVTAGVGVGASLVHRRGLVASAEALWAVFLGLGTVDWFAARAFGLWGTDRLLPDTSTLCWALLLLGASLAVHVAARGHLRRPLVVTEIGAGVGVVAGTSAASSLLARPIDSLFVVAVLSAGVATAGWAATRATRLVHAPVVLLTLVAVPASVAVLAAFLQVAEHPSARAVVLGLEGPPLLLVAVAAVVGTLRLPDGVRTAGAVLATLSLGTLLLVPVLEAADAGSGAIAGTGLLVVLAALAARPDPWSRGVRAVLPLLAFSLAAAVLPWATVIGEVLSRTMAVTGPELGVTERVRTTLTAPLGVPESVVVAIGVLTALALAARWPEVRDAGARPAVRWVVAAGAAALVLTVVADADPAAWVVALVAVLLGAVPALSRREPWDVVGGIVLVVAPCSVLASDVLTLVVALVVASTLGLLATTVRRDGWPVAATGASAAWLVLAVQPAATLLNARLEERAVATAVAAVLLLGASVVLRRHRERLGTDLVAAAAAFASLMMALTTTVDVADLDLVAFLLALLGVAATLASFVTGGPVYRWTGAALLGLAWVTRLAAAEVDVVEAYTAPFAAVLLVAGVVRLVRDDRATTARTLLPGVVLALVPSLPQALDDPTGLRALLLALVAAALLGVGLARRWQVPFAGGAAVLALLVLVNAAPYAADLPRWILIATLGMVLVGTGLTWERRVQDGRSAVQFVQEMR